MLGMLNKARPILTLICMPTARACTDEFLELMAGQGFKCEKVTLPSRFTKPALADERESSRLYPGLTGEVTYNVYAFRT